MGDRRAYAYAYSSSYYGPGAAWRDDWRAAALCSELLADADHERDDDELWERRPTADSEDVVSSRG